MNTKMGRNRGYMMDALAHDEITSELKSLQAKMQSQLAQAVGFPVATDLDYAELAPLFNTFMNNIGDPYDLDGLFRVHCKDLEQEVVAFYAELLNAPKEDFWGYVTSGSTEGNLYGMYAGRCRYPDATLFYSEAAHYSVPKGAHLLGLVAQKVRILENGEMDCAHLAKLLAAHRDKAAIIVATIGTTMTEARDDVEVIRQTARSAGVSRLHLHCDAALAGSYARFMEPMVSFDFAAGADTMAVSGYKYLGTPMPCGVVITRAGLKEPMAGRVDYIANPDVTISGSRSGQAPLAMWYAIKRLGVAGFRARYEQSLEMAEYAEQELGRIGWRIWRNPGALTVMLAMPPKPLRYKWQLATSNGWSHIICVPGLTEARIDAFVKELRHVKQHQALSRWVTSFQTAL